MMTQQGPRPGMPARNVEVMREFVKEGVPVEGMPVPGFAIARVGFCYLVGNADPYFTARAEVYASPARKARGDSERSVGPEEVEPRLANLERWALWGMDTGGMHYRANAIFWGDALTFRRAMDPKSGDTREGCIESFKDTVVWGALPGDEGEPWLQPLSALGEWLNARLPLLMSRFREDVEAALPGLWAETVQAMRTAAVQP